MYSLLTDIGGESGSIEVWFILLQLVKSKDDVNPFGFRHQGFLGANQGTHSDCEGKRLLVDQEHAFVRYLDPADTGGAMG